MPIERVLIERGRGPSQSWSMICAHRTSFFNIKTGRNLKIPTYIYSFFLSRSVMINRKSLKEIYNCNNIGTKNVQSPSRTVVSSFDGPFGQSVKIHCMYVLASKISYVKMRG